MEWILIIVVGGVLGWLASIVMRTDAQQGIFLNIIVGILGALLGRFLLTPLLGGGSITDGPLSLGNILVSLLGAIILLAIVNLVRRGRVR
ncbi:putative membrane protein YeaQ/YmgE (transglycosylase-associated protein family) [Sphingomonas kaistensis]|uniref:Putative membrane protein YeaQ/YmgE (Transglycosylase-associated protein family) n=1 Tax=Sphingomonas kaistensis TaxID=298708 RepID=A0A7X5Y5M8_9SPHN|nr:GlsB/YeaQ/YmgE family stress response membrane protein [Sphingomonas kaistensis]NJC05265.1 putative membrane protein YeaQ/YmgE (transglycosylase-associated protein family) [Sphingomonas kaistensis]